MTSLNEQVVVAVSFDGAFALVVETSLKATLLLGVACVAAVCRRTSAAMRHAIWAAGVTAVLALPILAYCLPSWNAVPFGGASGDKDQTTIASLPARQSNHGDLEPARSTSLHVRRSAEIPNDGVMKPPGANSNQQRPRAIALWILPTAARLQYPQRTYAAGRSSPGLPPPVSSHFACLSVGFACDNSYAAAGRSPAARF